MRKRVAGLVFAACAVLAACGGGGGGSGSPAAAMPTSDTGTASSPVSAPSGGAGTSTTTSTTTTSGTAPGGTATGGGVSPTATMAGVDREVIIAQGTASSPQSFPHIARLADGGYVVVWQQGGTDPRLRAQRYDANGNAVGPSLFMLQEAGRNRGIPSVAGLADGGFVVTFKTWVGEYDRTDFRQQVNVWTREPIGYTFEFPISRDGEGDVVGLADGSYVVFWEDGGVLAQRYRLLAPLGPAMHVTTGSDSYAQMNVTATPSGGYAAAWTNGPANGYQADTSHVHLQVFAADGTALAPPAEVALGMGPSSPFNSLESLRALPDGKLLFGFVRNEPDPAARDGANFATFAVVRADGTIAIAPTHVDPEPGIPPANCGGPVPCLSHHQFGVGVAALDDGGFAVTWVSPGVHPKTGMVRRFAADATPASPPTPTATLDQWWPGSHVITGIGSNGLVVAWDAAAAPTADNQYTYFNEYSVHARMWLPGTLLH